MRICLIAAASENNVIGADNRLSWDLPTDFAYYKNTVRHKPIIMGRKTAESPDFFFSEKRNIVVTRQEGYRKEGLEVANSLSEAFSRCLEAGEEEVFVTGGGELYRQALDKADVLYLTRVHAQVEGDAYFPEFAEKDWEQVSSEYHPADAQNSHAFTFLVYERRG